MYGVYRACEPLMSIEQLWCYYLLVYTEIALGASTTYLPPVSVGVDTPRALCVNSELVVAVR
jgi:hypothetical protein